MKNTYCNFNVSDKEKMAELEHMENLILGGADGETIQKLYPHYDKDEISRVVKNLARFYFMSDEEASTRTTANGKEYLVKSVFLSERGEGKEIKDAVLELAERKSMREMGINASLDPIKNKT